MDGINDRHNPAVLINLARDKFVVPFVSESLLCRIKCAGLLDIPEPLINAFREFRYTFTMLSPGNRYLKFDILQHNSLVEWARNGMVKQAVTSNIG